MADVGIAFFTLVIAINTFCVLFWDMKLRRLVLYATLVASWSAIAAIAIAGPATMNTSRHGPFCKSSFI